jgi:hypothetical protein
MMSTTKPSAAKDRARQEHGWERCDPALPDEQQEYPRQHEVHQPAKPQLSDLVTRT